jgi:DNA gyrase/topoisomerase IV subunit B
MSQDAKPKKAKTIEETYTMKTQHEHILSLPDTYIGSIVSDLKPATHVYNGESKKIEQQDISYPPGLYKIYDEILVNARDHWVRDKKCTRLEVTIDKESGWISVFNNGDGIPIQIHKEHKIYIPELIFGNLLSSSNYDKDEEKIVGGKNGLGAKLCNIYSKEFIIETIDAVSKKSYRQRYSDNMYNREEPVIKKVEGKQESFTKISFLPDYKRFGILGLTDDIISLFEKRVYDIAACTNLLTKLNGEKIVVKSFTDYIKMYYDKLPSDLVYEDFGERWHVGVVFDKNADFHQVSYVNGIATHQGGVHVDHVLTQISTSLIAHIKEKNKDINIKTSHVKENITVFINCDIVNPGFSSQTKEYLTTKVSDFGSKCVLTEDFMKKLMKTGIVDEVIGLAQYKQQGELSKSDFKKTNNVSKIAKLKDAEWAGKAGKSKHCRLILTEGDSANSFALHGVSVLPEGNQKFGVFPLRGKFLNVREASIKQLTENKEFLHLKQIIGLRQNAHYKDANKLRYGGIILLTDQDSVTGDTPLLLQDSKTNLINIRTIDNIGSSEWKQEGGKEVSQTCFNIWTDKGWTKIVKVIRHKVNKKIFRVLTHTGVVDVTEDHSLLNSDGTEISPKDCVIGQELLHSFPKFDDKNKFPIIEHENNMNEKEAYVMGLCFASENYKKNEYVIKGSNSLRLCESIDFLKKNYSFKTEEFCSTTNEKMLWPKANIMEKVLAIQFLDDELFFDKIFNSSDEIRRNFLEGYFCGKDCKKLRSGTLFVDIQKKIDAHVVYFLCKSLGHEVFVNTKQKQDEKSSYTLSITKSTDYVQAHPHPNKIKKIIDMGITEQYVYDLETENHHFQAGVGQMIVHNTDGFHIKGLLINLFDFFWPSLLKVDGFIQSMSTPIVKIYKKVDDKKKNPINFYSLTTYEKWIEANNMSLYQKPKYYKGLGTSTAAESKEIFKEFDNRVVNFVWEPCLEDDTKKTEKEKKVVKKAKPLKQNNDDTKSEISEMTEVDEEEEEDDACDSKSLSREAIVLAFAKDRANDRKTWLAKYDKDEILDISKKNVKLSDFVNKELIHFSAYDNNRSIPCIMDGLKPSQRKILYGTFKKNIKSEIKVAQLGAYISEHTAYHHGEASLFSTIITMAQNYVGSNNINILFPAGEFGTRRMMGKDAASPRYIFTHLTNITKLIFRQDDEAILKYNYDDEKQIEPEYFAPIIPLILVNGTKGIGTGYSTEIHSHNPLEIIEALRNMINGKDPVNLNPWFRGFEGKIVMNKSKGKNGFFTIGNYEVIDANTIVVTEIPISTSIDSYKDFLIDLEYEKTPDAKHFVHGFTYDSDPNKVKFTIKLADGYLQDFIKTDNIVAKLKLKDSHSMNNMYMHNSSYKMKKYTDVREIMHEFYNTRLVCYNKRKEHILKVMKEDLDQLKEKKRFVEYVVGDKIIVSKRKRVDIIADLVKHKFKMYASRTNKNKKESEDNEENEENEESAGEENKMEESKTGPNYKYLTSMQLFSLSYEKMEELAKQCLELQKAYDTYLKKTVQTIWLEELDELEKAYAVFLADLENDDNEKKNKKKGGKATKKVVKKNDD